MSERLRLSITFNHAPYPNQTIYTLPSLPEETFLGTIKEVLAERDRRIALGLPPKREIEIIGSSEYKFKKIKPCEFHSDFTLMLDWQEPKLKKICLDTAHSFAVFPESGGIYFCVRDSEVWYIGKANNFQSRWRNHHKLEALKTIKGIVIFFMPVYRFSDAEIHKAEQEYIQMLQPVFNNTSRPEKYLRLAS